MGHKKGDEAQKRMASAMKAKGNQEYGVEPKTRRCPICNALITFDRGSMNRGLRDAFTNHICHHR